MIAKLLRTTTRNREAAAPAASHALPPPHVPQPVLPLPLLTAGQRAKVDAVLGEGDLVRRLRELGLCDGAEVCMVRPGCPCIIRMGTQKFCFRADELNTVLVRPGAAG